jgi:hypothetical protein
VGALRLHSLEGELQKLADVPDAGLRESVQVALNRLSGEPEPSQPPVPAGMDTGVG